jgi:hypothetical protein
MGWSQRLGLGVALFVSSLVGCATYKVNTDFDARTDFSHFRTFTIAEGRVVRAGIGDTGDTLSRTRIANAIGADLASRGLVPARQGAADLSVRFTAGSQTLTMVQRTVPAIHGVAYNWPAYNDLWLRTFERGTLIIEVRDTTTDRPVWQSVAVANDVDFSTPESVKKAVTKALAQFPPRRG